MALHSKISCLAEDFLDASPSVRGPQSLPCKGLRRLRRLRERYWNLYHASISWRNFPHSRRNIRRLRERRVRILHWSVIRETTIYCKRSYRDTTDVIRKHIKDRDRLELDELNNEILWKTFTCLQSNKAPEFNEMTNKIPEQERRQIVTQLYLPSERIISTAKCLEEWKLFNATGHK